MEGHTQKKEGHELDEPLIVTNWADNSDGVENLIITQRLCDNNVRLLTACFFCVCVGYAGFQTLSVPLYAPSKVGATAVGTQVLVFTFCCLGPNTLIADWLGRKKALQAAFVGELLYCIANVVAVYIGPGSRQYFVLLPFACIVGLSNAVMWTVQGLFITHNAAHVARLSGVKQETVTGRYFGLFNTFSDLTGLVAFIVQSASGLDTMYLFGVFGVLACLGLVMSLWLTDLPELDEDEEQSTGGGGDASGGGGSLLAHIHDAVSMWCNKRFMLVIPFFCYIGLSDGFEDGVFSAIVVAKNVGTHRIGYVMAAFSISW
jgi:hypothetical protein